MSLRPLIIGPEERAAAVRIIAYAEKHPYYVGDAMVPGNIPQHVLIWTSGYRAVFSMTASGGVLWKHLSVSVPGEHLPNPEAVKAIGVLFGFTPEPIGRSGFPTKWGIELSKHENCVVVGEKTAIPSRSGSKKN